MIKKIILICFTFFSFSLFLISCGQKSFPLLEESDQLRLESLGATGEDRNEIALQGLAKLEEARLLYHLDNGPLYYNMGNLFYMAGKRGEALRFYKKALLRNPLDSMARKNLKFLRTTVENRIAPKEIGGLKETILFFHYDLSPNFKWSLLCISLIFIFSSLSILSFRKIRYLPQALAFSLLVTLLMGGSLIAKSWESPEGVILSPEVIMRKGDSLGYEAALVTPLYEGQEFFLLERRDDWMKISLGEAQGWIPSFSASIID